MADAQLDKSLDALIAEKGGAKKGGFKGIRVKESKTMGAAKAKRGGSSTQRPEKTKPNQRAPTHIGIQSKKIAKPKSEGRRQNGRGPAPRGPFMAPYMAPHGGFLPQGFMVPPGYMLQPIPQPQRAQGGGSRPVHQKRDPDADGKWRHDMFDASDRAPPRRQSAAPASAPSTTLEITNLHHNVSQEDITELFQTVGALVSSRLDYDASGRSLGTATVVFKTHSDAMEAIKQYNNVALDNKKMSIKLREEREVTRLSSGIKVTKPDGGYERTEAGGGGQAGRGQGAGRMFQQALPRGMGDGGSGPPRRGGARIRSSVATSYGGDDMME